MTPAGITPLLRALAACAALLLAVPALAQEAPSGTPTPLDQRGAGLPVKEIVVQGNEKTARSYILSRMVTKPGRLYDPAEMDEDLKRLHQTGYFTFLEYHTVRERDGVQINLIVIENQPVNQVTYEGRRHLRREEIQPALRTRPGVFLSPSDLTADSRVIEEMYRRRGYYHASVTTRTSRVATGVDVTFVIVEGPKVSVRDIRFEGNETFSEGKLRKVMKTKQSIWLLSTGTYDEEKMQEDIVTLRRFYRDEGFLDAEVDLEALELSDNKSKLDLILRVVEGPRYTVRTVDFEGMQLFDPEKLRPFLKLQPDQPFRTEWLLQDRKELMTAYGNVGYIFREVSPQTTYAAEGHQVDVLFKVEENEQIKIGLIHIRGNEHTKDKVVRRDLEFFPNERASQTRVERSIERLKARDYYETVDYTFVETDDPHVRDAIVTVKEKPTGKAKFGLGLTSNAGVVGEISISKQNFDFFDFPRDLGEILDGSAFTGAGQFFLIEAQPGTSVQRYRVSFQEPYLFDRPVSLTLGGFYFQRTREEFTEKRIGFNSALGRRLTRDIGVELAYAVELIQVDEVRPDAPIDVRSVKGQNLSSSLRLSLGIDKRDNPFLPTRGYRGGLTGELYGGPLGGDFDFWRVRANYSTHWTLWRDKQQRPWVISAGARVGAMIPYGGTDETPVFERFFAGGAGSIRGFGYRGISPRQNGEVVGGDAEIQTSVELGFPVYGDLFRGVVFFDAGSVDTSLDRAFGSFRASVGTGLRISIPFLGPRPLALDFGIPLVEQDGDYTSIFSFDFGRDF